MKSRPGYKKCKTCNRWKAHDQFYSCGRGRLKAHCKRCYNSSRSKTGRTITRRPIVDGKRQCPGCGLWLDASAENFHRKAHGTGLHTTCKACRSKEHKRYMKQRRAAHGRAP
jgi:hypothetical protein